jgi:peptidoglycan/LPS O-acetylase OafA/YrhL
VWVSLTGIDYSQPWSAPRNLVASTWNLALMALALASARRLRTMAPDRRLLGLVGFAGATVMIVTVAMLMAGPVGLRYRMSLAGMLWLVGAVTLSARGRHRWTAGHPRQSAPS